MTTNTAVDWAIDMLPTADSVTSIQQILRSSARAGVRAQGATVVWLDHDMCYYADEDTMSPLWKGQRFPVRRCISGWSMLHDHTVVVPDIFIDDRIPQEAYRPTFVRSLVMVPIRVDRPVGAIGAYWARLHEATTAEVATLERLAAAAGQALRVIADRNAVPGVAQAGWDAAVPEAALTG
ncbi:MAG TPA: GAF domain-containing protein [Micromonosporaceae bacterium]